MDKETYKKLTKNFPKDMVKPAPKGKFGSYVPHHLYTQRLVDVVGGKYNFFVKEVLRDKDNAVVGAVCVLEIEDLGRMEEVGDVDMNALNRNITESEILKLAVSDGIKRCCMRFGIGLELWTGGETEEEHYAGGQEQPKKKQVVQESGKSPSNNVKELGEIILDMCVGNKVLAKTVWDYTVGKVDLKKDMPKSVKDYTEDNNKTFIEEAAKYLKMINDQNKERSGNTEVINQTLDILDAKITETKNKKESEEDMDFDNDDWKEGKEQDPMTDAQKGFLQTLITQCTDNGLDELAAQAKQYLNSGNTSKVTCSDMISKLKNALS
jgi:hypothetical protein